MAEPTPTPWKQSGCMIYAPGEHGGVICELSEPRVPTTIDGKVMHLVEHTPLRLGSPDAAEAYANGARIVQAVNAFAPLVHALEAFMRDEQRHLDGETHGTGFCVFCSANNDERIAEQEPQAYPLSDHQPTCPYALGQAALAAARRSEEEG